MGNIVLPASLRPLLSYFQMAFQFCPHLTVLQTFLQVGDIHFCAPKGLLAFLRLNTDIAHALFWSPPYLLKA